MKFSSLSNVMQVIQRFLHASVGVTGCFLDDSYSHRPARDGVRIPKTQSDDYPTLSQIIYASFRTVLQKSGIRWRPQGASWITRRTKGKHPVCNRWSLDRSGPPATICEGVFAGIMDDLPLGQVKLEETRRDTLCSVQGSGGRCGLHYGTCDGRLPTVGLHPLRQDLCHRQR